MDRNVKEGSSELVDIPIIGHIQLIFQSCVGELWFFENENNLNFKEVCYVY